MKNIKKLLAILLVVVTILAGIGNILLTINGYKVAGDVCFGIFWLCLGVSYWKTNRKMAIADFVLAGLWFLTAVLRLLFP